MPIKLIHKSIHFVAVYVNRFNPPLTAFNNKSVFIYPVWHSIINKIILKAALNNSVLYANWSFIHNLIIILLIDCLIIRANISTDTKKIHTEKLDHQDYYAYSILNHCVHLLSTMIAKYILFLNAYINLQTFLKIYAHNKNKYIYKSRSLI